MKASTGMKTFMIVWCGQLASLLGTAMTRFALMIWAYEQTGEATTLALLGFFSFIFFVLLSPLAGIAVDRFDRRKIMIVNDLGAGMMTVVMLVLYLSGDLRIWHLYLAEALTGAFEAFQVPAYMAASTLLVPKEQYARASALRTLAFNISKVFAPFLGGLLLTSVDLPGVMAVDIVTFAISTAALLLVRFPRPAISRDGQAASGGLWHQLRFGFGYIWVRPGLRGLMGIMAGINLFASLTYFGVLPAMVLARSGGDELALASVQSTLGIAGVIGGLLVTTWGGFRRQIHNVLLLAGLSFIGGDLLFATGQSTAVWMLAAFVGAFFVPFISSGYRAIWQRKVAPDVQGRVFAAQTLIDQISVPLGYLFAGPLADRLFEPAMMPGGSLSGVFGGWIGSGAGAGMGLMFLCTAVLGMLASFSGYLFRDIRRVEDDLPDHDTHAVEHPALAQAEAAV